jgi:FeS assembly protein IscX
MPQKLNWTDIEDLALLLREKFPNVDPLSVRFTDLQRWVCELPDFADAPQSCNEQKLEAIQMAWHEEYEAGEA